MSHVFAASHNLALHEVVESPRLQKQFVLLITAALLFEHHTACGEQRFTDASGFLRANRDTAHTGYAFFVVGLRRNTVYPRRSVVYLRRHAPILLRTQKIAYPL